MSDWMSTPVQYFSVLCGGPGCENERRGHGERICMRVSCLGRERCSQEAIMSRRWPSRFAFVGLVVAWSASAMGLDSVPPREGLEQGVGRVEAFINELMEVQDLPAVSIALVEGPRVVWARGFGLAKP